MLFEQRFWPLVADGTVDLTFRRWKRLQVVAGRRYRSPMAILEVLDVREVDPAAIGDDDARRAGFASADELRSQLRGTADLPTYRVEFRPCAEPDPRAQLAADDELAPDDVAAITARLARLDRASAIGPWTMATLELIEARPAVRAGDMADALGRERQPFKTDVRKLKNLGLTLSLEVGYRLSPRGQAFLRAVRVP